MGKKTKELILEKTEPLAKNPSVSWIGLVKPQHTGAHLGRRAKKDKWAYGPKQTAGRSRNSRRST